MAENLRVRNRAGHRGALIVDKYGRRRHHVAAGAGGVSGLDRVAGSTGDAFVFERTCLRHALGEVSGEESDRVVAALAVARELDSLFADEQVHVLQIPGLTEAVRVNRLPPLVVGLLMAVAAVLGRGNAARVDELTVGRHRVRGQEGMLFPEGVVVTAADGVVELSGRPRNPDVGGVCGWWGIRSGGRRSGRSGIG